jgi:hypothetical protein
MMVTLMNSKIKPVWKTEKLIDLISSNPENIVYLSHSLLYFLTDFYPWDRTFFEIFENADYEDFVNFLDTNFAFDEDKPHVEMLMNIFENLPDTQVMYATDDSFGVTPRVIEISELLGLVLSKLDLKDNLDEETDEELSNFLEERFSDVLYGGDVSEFKNESYEPQDESASKSNAILNFIELVSNDLDLVIEHNGYRPLAKLLSLHGKHFISNVEEARKILKGDESREIIKDTYNVEENLKRVESGEMVLYNGILTLRFEDTATAFQDVMSHFIMYTHLEDLAVMFDNVELDYDISNYYRDDNAFSAATEAMDKRLISIRESQLAKLGEETLRKLAMALLNLLNADDTGVYNSANLRVVTAKEIDELLDSVVQAYPYAYPTYHYQSKPVFTVTKENLYDMPLHLFSPLLENCIVRANGIIPKEYNTLLKNKYDTLTIQFIRQDSTYNAHSTVGEVVNLISGNNASHFVIHETIDIIKTAALYITTPLGFCMDVFAFTTYKSTYLNISETKVAKALTYSVTSYLSMTLHYTMRYSMRQPNQALMTLNKREYRRFYIKM